MNTTEPFIHEDTAEDGADDATNDNYEATNMIRINRSSRIVRSDKEFLSLPSLFLLLLYVGDIALYKCGMVEFSRLVNSCSNISLVVL